MASFLHGKTEFMESDETALQERATEFCILKFGEAIITLTSLTARVTASISCILGTVLNGHIMYVSIHNSQ